MSNELEQGLPNDVLSATSDEQGADFIETQLEITDEDKQNTAKVVGNFIYAYGRKPREQSNQDWLIKRFVRYGRLWSSQDELKEDARIIVTEIESFYKAEKELTEYENQGGTRNGWLAKQIEAGATVHGFNNVGQYAGHIDHAINQSNDAMRSLMYRKNGTLNEQLNLDGFVAEQHHASSFNIDATAKGSNLRAEVLKPESGYTKNSVDIVIKDENGKIVRRYQAKYGADGKATGRLFEKGNYRGQRKLVPEGHTNDVQNSTDHIEMEGVSSRPLSKDEAKKIQQQMQEQEVARQYTWNDADRTVIAKNIGNQAVVASALACGFQGARILGRRIWNNITNKENQSIQEDLKEFVSSSLKSGASAGMAVAVTGAMTVAVKSGWLGKTLVNTPVACIANAVTLGVENIKIVGELVSGKIAPAEAFDKSARTTTIMTGSLALGVKGASIGASLGATLGPVGTVIGGVAGGVVGSMLGSTVADKLYNAGKSIASSAVSAVKSFGSVIGNVGSAIGSLFGW